MDYIVIDGSNPWRGRYEFDLAESVQTLTLREWGWIKKLSGYLPATIGDGLTGADAELIGTLAVVALCRHGKIEKREVPDTFERLIDSSYTAVRLEFGEVEDDAGPPGDKLDRERDLFWARFGDEFGNIGSPPGRVWDARLGYFAVRPDDVEDMTPVQLMGCVDLFAAMHESDA